MTVVFSNFILFCSFASFESCTLKKQIQSESGDMLRGSMKTAISDELKLLLSMWRAELY